MRDDKANTQTSLETYKIEIMQASYGYIEVEADSIPDAMEKAEKFIDERIEDINWSYGKTIPVYADTLDKFVKKY